MSAPRRAGILLHPTSLPGPGPAGDLGAGAVRFLDWLQAAGQTLWQLLPLNPPGAGLSPYDSPSALALGTHLVSLEALVDQGLLDAAELAGRPTCPPGRVDAAALTGWHAQRVQRAAERLDPAADPALASILREIAPWAHDHALYMALTKAHPDSRGWWDLPAPLRDRHPDALARARETHAAEIRRHLHAQVLVHHQWARLRTQAHARGIQLVGDVPIFVSGGGVDTWVHRDLFLWGRDAAGGLRPDPVAGVPPDYFSPKGQRWGNPLYDWPAHADTDFAWWKARLRAVLAQVDAVRIDHFRGFVAAWHVPADAPDATTGGWQPGPGRALFDALAADLRADPPAALRATGWSPDDALPVIAEDLGLITDDVHALRDGLELPGMKILQFAFGGGWDHPFLPQNYAHERWVAYTGTHDNDTVVGWYAAVDESVRDRMRRYLSRDGREPHWQLLHALHHSVARWAVAPLQDVLGLDSRARMNVPGEAEGNWLWRATDLPEHAARRLCELTETSGRRP
ncbi:MAG: 4-alpha-glucanotransferase [Alphaproteobacteria bacterium]|nr:4-alpha-glucanotransferase [Alphaproteobacteria bacterium]